VQDECRDPRLPRDPGDPVDGIVNATVWPRLLAGRDPFLVATGRLLDAKNAQQDTAGVRNSYEDWHTLQPAERVAALRENVIEPVLKELGVPFPDWTLADGGGFDPARWEASVPAEEFEAGSLGNAAFIQVVTEALDGARYAWQYYAVARKLAGDLVAQGREDVARSVAESMKVPVGVAARAASAPLRPGSVLYLRAAAQWEEEWGPNRVDDDTLQADVDARRSALEQARRGGRAAPEAELAYRAAWCHNITAQGHEYDVAHVDRVIAAQLRRFVQEWYSPEQFTVHRQGGDTTYRIDGTTDRSDSRVTMTRAAEPEKYLELLRAHHRTHPPFSGRPHR
jgi:hypothetical protein